MNTSSLILRTTTMAGLLLASACVAGGDMRGMGQDDATGGMLEGDGADTGEGGTGGVAETGTDGGDDEGDTSGGVDDAGLEDSGGADTGGSDGGDGADTGDTGEVDTGEPPPPMADPDGDSPVAPAVIALFRATSGAPVTVDAPLVGQTDPLDVRGLEYLGAVSDPGDPADWVQFSIVPGETDPTITITLDCDNADLDPQPMRATLLADDGSVVDTILCGEGPHNVLLENASSFDDWQIRVELLEGASYDGYSLQIDAFCFPTCNFQPL